MADDLTPERCLDVYNEVWNDSDTPDTERGREIVAEMRAIADAPDLDAAVAVIAWWWGPDEVEDDHRAEVARARALLRGEPVPEVQADRAAVVAHLHAAVVEFLHAAGYHAAAEATAEAVARGELLEKA